MSKVVKIENDIVSIGNNDGSLSEIRLSDCNFNPIVGDKVEIYSSNNKTICVKSEDKKEDSDISNLIKNGGININLTQNQGSADMPYYCNDGSKKAVNKIAYIILAIFLGGIGIHKFYAGKTGKGILYLLFCWTYIPSIIGLIEGFCACFQKEDNNGRILV